MSTATKATAGILGAMYLNAKFNICNDLKTIYRGIKIKSELVKLVQEKRINIYYRFKEKAKENPNRVFLIFEDKAYTFLDIERASNQLANWLLAQNVQRQDRVCMMHQNHPTFIITWLAIVKIGAVAAFINHNLSDDSLLHCVTIVNSKLLLFDPVYKDQVATIVDRIPSTLKLVAYGEETEKDDYGSLPFAEYLSPSVLSNCSSSDVSEDCIQKTTPLDIAMLIYTSGTTGMPKAASISHIRTNLAAMGYSSVMNLTPSDRMFSVLPLYHSSGFLISFISPLYANSAIVLGRKFSASRFWDDIVKYEATTFIYIGELCRYLLNSPVHPQESKHKIRVICGNGMRPDVWNRFRDRFKIPTIVEFFGATEGLGTTMNVNHNEYGAGAIGLKGPLLRLFTKNIKIVKVDPESGEPLRGKNGYLIEANFGENGEMVAEVDPNPVSPMYFKGYYNNSSGTNKKLIHDAFKKGDCYYRTGDIIKMNKDGFLYFVDRGGDSFRWKSENVATTEVAHAVSTFPGIIEANVYGTLVPGNDGRAGMAAIVIENETSFDFKGLATHLQQKLPSYAVPLFLRIVPAMDTTGTFKHQKVSFRNQGIDLNQIPSDQPIYWLKNGTYSLFDHDCLNQIVTGKTKL
ncbi:unnamed protein product [Cunninghamella echinulata]